MWAYSTRPIPSGRPLFPKVLGQMDTEGLAGVAATCAAALAAGRPIPLALTAPWAMSPTPVDVPSALRDLEVPSGCAADYDGWLTAVTA